MRTVVKFDGGEILLGEQVDVSQLKHVFKGALKVAKSGYGVNRKYDVVKDQSAIVDITLIPDEIVSLRIGDDKKKEDIV